jgi:pimeloyl-ACP methyl ester carboxylesterase
MQCESGKGLLTSMMRGKRPLAIFGAAAFAITTVFAQAAKAESSPAVERIEGKLADGTPYLLRKPSNWNGIVVTDLDGIFRGEDGVYQLLLKAGYGTAGANRRPWDRFWTLNRRDDVRRPQEALAIFRERLGKPRFVIAFGGSAGGAVALLTAEHHPDTVDGAVAMCATMPFGHAHYNVIFDFFYTAKALLAPNDDRLLTHSLPPRGYEAVLDHWREVLEAAAKTPEGRARIALAFTMAQYPLFGSKSTIAGVKKPDFEDTDAVILAMTRLIPDVVSRLVHLTVHSEKDWPPDLQIRGTPQPNVVGNDGAVYADYWQNSDPVHKRVTEAIYARAGLDVAADLKTLDAAPRVKLDRSLLGVQGLVGRGLITMPVFRMDNLGDISASPNTSKLYDALVEANGLTHLYRTSYVDNSGHCFFKPEHEFMAIEVMRERLETGKWPDTSAAALNARIGFTESWVLDSKTRTDDRGMRFVDAKFGPYTGMWRLWEYPDGYQPATFASATKLVKSYDASALTSSQRRLLLNQLSAAERFAKQGQAAEAHRALDRFVGAAESATSRVVRTRLLATAHQLRRTIN